MRSDTVEVEVWSTLLHFGQSALRIIFRVTERQRTRDRGEARQQGLGCWFKPGGNLFGPASTFPG